LNDTLFIFGVKANAKGQKVGFVTRMAIWSPNNWQMRSFPNPVILEQVSAQQPPFLLIVLMYILPFWLLAAIFKMLLLWTPFVELSLDYPKCYQAIFFISQVMLICSIVIISSTKFLSALWKPHAATCHAGLVSLIVLLPVLYYIFRGIRLLDLLAKATNSPNIQLHQVHDALWMALPYGASLDGVFFSSAVMIFGPIFEEIIFTGFLVNMVLKKYGLLSTIIVVPIIFTFAHIPQQGLGMHLLPIFCSGSAFVLIRLISGNLFYSVVCHMIINCIFLFPGWVEAYIFFNT
jgi:membrane protease YdiL (CAAX protease family)